MPTYDYKCDACEHQWELFQSIKAEPEKTCPACGKKKARRLIGTGAGIIFRGSGFYLTDYRSESYKKAAAADSKSESNGAGSKSDSSSNGSSNGSASKSSEAKAAPSGE